MPRVWPYPLPGHSMTGYTQKPFPTADRTDFESGAARSRRRTLAQRFETGITWTMTDAEFAAFGDWYHGRAVSLAGSSSSTESWVRNNATRQADVLVGPDDILSDKIVETVSTSTHTVRRDLPDLVGDNVVLLAHVAVKAEGRSRVRVGISARTGIVAFVDLNLSTGQVNSTSGVLDYQILDRGQGWWAVILKADIGTGSSIPFVRVQMLNGTSTTYTGDGVSGVGLAEIMVRESTGYDLFVPCDASGRGFGSDGEAGWFFYDMPMGGGLTRTECRFMSPYQTEGLPGFHWRVSAAIEVRYA